MNKTEKSKENGLQFHEAAEIFPLMSDDGFDLLVESIRTHGLREPLILIEGKLLDGRNRYNACLKLGIQPTTHDISVSLGCSPVEYVLDRNLHRRQLANNQRALSAARALPLVQEEAKERRRRGPAISVPVNLPEQTGDARDIAAKQFSVSGKTVDYARKIVEQGCPQLIRAVERDRLSVSLAAKVAGLPREQQEDLLRGTKQEIREALGTSRSSRNETLQRRPESLPKPAKDNAPPDDSLPPEEICQSEMKADPFDQLQDSVRALRDLLPKVLNGRDGDAVTSAFENFATSLGRWLEDQGQITTVEVPF